MQKSITGLWYVFVPMFLVFGFLHGYSQVPHPSFKQYTFEQGLPSSRVYQVKQDSKGYIWFATHNGVSRFNGYEFQNFTTSDGLPDNMVYEIFEDAVGRIWFVPHSCQLSYYQNGKIHLYKYNQAFLKGIKRALKTSFYVSANGTVFIGLSNEGVYEIKPNGAVKIHKEEGADMFLMEPAPGIFLHSSNSFVKFNSINYRSGRGVKEIQLNEDIGQFTAASRVVKLSDGRILICNAKKLVVLNQSGEPIVLKFPFRVIWMYEDADHEIWLGTYLGGVYRCSFDLKTQRQYLNGNSVNGVLQDKEGGFWFCSQDNAVFYTASKNILTFDEEAGLKGNRPWDLLYRNNVIYVGMRSGFLHKINSDFSVETINCNVNNEGVNGITRMFYDTLKNEVLVSGGVASGKLKNNAFFVDADIMRFNQVIYIPSGLRWFLTSSGIEYKNEEQGGIIVLDTSQSLQPAISAMLNGDQLYVGAQKGLYSVNWKNNNVEFLGVHDANLRNRVTIIEKLNNGYYAVAVQGVGIVLYNGKQSRLLDVANRLNDENCTALLAKGDTLWMADDRGLHCVVLKNYATFDYSIQHINKQNGLASNEVSDILYVNDTLWVCTYEGVSFFNRKNIVRELDKKYVPFFYITNISINNIKYAYKSKCQLPYNQNNIKVEFIALGYKNTGKQVYRYMLKGLNNRWQYTTNREVEFTTLPSNTYTLVLAVQNSKGEWVNCKSSLKFTISPPYWKTWWFMLCVVALLAYAIWRLFKYRLQKARVEQERKASITKAMLELRLKALRAQMNPHFTFNVMNSIQSFILKNDTGAANKYLSRFSKLIRIILSNSEEPTIPLADELKALELYLELESMRFEDQFGYVIDIDPNLDIKTIEVPSMLIQPYVENAIKHGILTLPTKGLIKITITQQENGLQCVIEDNGVGRVYTIQKNKQTEHKSMGTSITQDRLKTLSALYGIYLTEETVDLIHNDGTPAGTKVILTYKHNQ